jgi:hypothetical protein
VQHPPDDLDEVGVLEAVVDGWNLPAGTASYLPVGFGSHHWTLTSGSGTRWFATADVVTSVDVPADLEAAFSVPAAAELAGLRGVLAPLRAVTGSMVVVLGGAYALSVQPWLEGTSGRFGDRWSDADAVALTELVADLHGIPVSATGARPEDVGVPGSGALERVLGAVSAGRRPEVWGSGPLVAEVLDLVHRHAGPVRKAMVAADAHPPGDGHVVLTHGEPHPGNVVVSDAGPVLVDWETARVAEPERDLWLLAARTDLDVAGLYAERTGRRPDAVRLSRRALRWALADVASFVPTLLAAPEETADTAWQLEALTGTLEALG